MPEISHHGKSDYEKGSILPDSLAVLFIVVAALPCLGIGYGIIRHASSLLQQELLGIIERKNSVESLPLHYEP